MRDEPELPSDSHLEDPVDLSVLDPMRDPDRWQQRVGETLRRVVRAMVEAPLRDDALSHIARWRRPLMTAAIAASLLLGIIELALERREGMAERVERLVAVSAHWVPGQPPTGADFVRALSTPSDGQVAP